MNQLKTNKTKFTSLLLTLLILFSVCPAAIAQEPDIPVLAEQSAPADITPEATGSQPLPAPTAPEPTSSAALTVALRAQAEGAFLLPHQTTTITAGKAAAYGYQNAASIKSGEITALDAAVAAHEALFGSDFTPETAQDYFAVTGGSVSRLFGIDTSSVGYLVNGVQPHSDTWVEGSGGYPGYFMAYAINECVLHNNDTVEFYIYRDEYALDYLAWFEQDAHAISSLTAAQGQNISLTLRGYSVGYYGASDAATIEAKTTEVGGAQLALADSYGNLTDITGKLTDEDNGSVTLSFAQPGDYVLTAYITDEDIEEYYATPILMPWLPVHITETAQPKPSNSLQALTIATVPSAFKNTLAEPAEEQLSPALRQDGIDDAYWYYVNTNCTAITIKPTVYAPADVKSITAGGTAVASGSATTELPLHYGNNSFPITITKTDDTQETYNLIVRRKQPAVIQSYTVENGTVSAPIEAGKWTSSATFPHDAQTVKLTFDLPAGCVIRMKDETAAYRTGEPIPVPVGDNSTKLVTFLVSQEVTENEQAYTDTHGYVIGLYRMAGSAPDAVAFYLPAPGQFVNQEAYRNPVKTLAGPSAGGLVTLGAAGGSIIYSFDPPITNDPANPYGIDFIVHGNAFRNADGSSSSSAAEPAAVMVSEDGASWYELAGSRYYDAAVQHHVTITYQNPDQAFSGAMDVPWTDSNGASGKIAVPTNSQNKQPYFPNPEYYAAYNVGSMANNSYSAASMTVSLPTLFDAVYSPAYGYGDVHASDSQSPERAVNPYAANHYAHTNGDGMDLAWAVDKNGDPVSLSSVRYVKLYNPTLRSDGSLGETSPEIGGVLRAVPAAQAVGKSDGLQALSINGAAIPLEPNQMSYSFDSAGAAALTITPTAVHSDANIYINDTFVPSGTASPAMLPSRKLRIVVQEGEKEPVIYTLTDTGAGDTAANAGLASVSLIPGELTATPGADNTFTAELPYDTSSMKVRAVPLNQKATVRIGNSAADAASDWVGSDIFSVPAGGTQEIALSVTSQDGTTTTAYRLLVHRAAQGGGSSGSKNITVTFTLIGDSKHGSPEKHQATQTWLSKRSCTIPAGSTVKYLTDKLLIEAGIPFVTDASGSYIVSIKELAELDNGPRSGWIYTLNGTQDGVDGYAIQTLKQGDAIVWRYTDDYTKEPSSPSGSGGSSGGSSTVKTDSAGTALAPKAVITGQTASVSVAQAALETAVKNAVKQSEKQVSIAPQSIDDAEQVTMSLPMQGVRAAAQSRIGLQLHLNAATLVLPHTALSEWAEQGGQILTVSAHRQADGALSLTAAIDGAPAAPCGMLASLPTDLSGVDAVAAALAGDDSKTILPKCMAADESMLVWLDGSQNIQVKSNPQSFSDTASHWGSDGIRFAAARELMRGITESTFAPNAPLTRGMLVTILHRLENEPNANAAVPFEDVSANAWYANAIAWAAETGLAKGSGNGFQPEDNITREQLAALFYRYAQIIGLDTFLTDAQSPFADAAELSPWAADAAAWCVQTGILTGKENNRLDPSACATRAEAATMLMRLIGCILHVEELK